MNDQLENAKKVLEFLTTKGHKAYLVGGFVRDFLLGMTTDDIDITTNARPEQVMDYFPGSKATGIKFGTVTVIMEKDKFEVTTFRTESRYRDSRHPEKIKFADSLDEDLKRRDFTINALAMDLKGTVIDRFFGKEDLKDRLIRAIGNPTDRFQEDALRMLRAFRFVAKLDFDIETKTLEAITASKDLLKRIANERIFQELNKIIIYPHTLKALCLMRDAGIPSVLPGLKRGIDHLSKLDQIDLEPLEFYALCFVLNDGEIPQSWRFSNKDRQQIEQIVKLVLDKKNSEINELDIFNYGKKNSLQANRVLTMLGWGKDLSKTINSWDKSMPIHSIGELKFKGQEIVDLTPIKDQRLIGKILDETAIAVIKGKLKNEHDDIRKFVMQYLENLEKGNRK